MLNYYYYFRMDKSLYTSLGRITRDVARNSMSVCAVSWGKRVRRSEVSTSVRPSRMKITILNFFVCHWHAFSLSQSQVENWTDVLCKQNKGVVQWSQSSKTCNGIGISRKNLHQIGGFKFLAILWYTGTKIGA